MSQVKITKCPPDPRIEERPDQAVTRYPALGAKEHGGRVPKRSTQSDRGPNSIMDEE